MGKYYVLILMALFLTAVCVGSVGLLFLPGSQPVTRLDTYQAPTVASNATSYDRGFCLVWCAGDPRDGAQAEVIAEAGRQDAQNQELARIQAQAAFELAAQAEAARLATDQAEREATSAAWVQSWQQYVKYSMFAATLATCALLLSVAGGLGWAAVGTGRAVAQVAQVRANLLHMDKDTRSYPVLLHHIDRGRFALADMTTGTVKLLDVASKGDRDLIRGVNAARLAGTVAQEARHHQTTPGGVFLAADNALALLQDVRHE